MIAPSWAPNVQLLWRGALVVLSILLAILSGHWLADWVRPLTPNAVALQLMAENKPHLAAHLFENPQHKGVALYRAGQFQRAAREFATDDSIAASYNLANALAQYGRYEQAIRTLQSVLSRQPNHADALHNLDVIRAAARLARRKRDPDREGAAADRPDESAQGPMKSLASLDSDQDIQTISDEPGHSDDKSAHAEQLAASRSQVRPGVGTNSAKNSTSDLQIRPGSVFASGTTGDQNQALTDYLTRTAPSAPPSPKRSDEKDIAAQISLRHIQDDPALVLRARLHSAWSRRNGERQ